MLKAFKFGPLRSILCTECGYMLEDTGRGYIVIGPSVRWKFHREVCDGKEELVIGMVKLTTEAKDSIKKLVSDVKSLSAAIL